MINFLELEVDIPENLRYTKDHEWVLEEGAELKVGVTCFAVEQLGDIVHVDLPEQGQEFEAGEAFGTIESTKTVSDLFMPVAGKVTELNPLVLQTPEEVGAQPYEGGWLVKVKANGVSAEQLLNSGQYESYIKEQS